MKWAFVGLWVLIMVLIHLLADLELLNDFFPWKKQLNINDVFGHFVLVGILGFFAALVAKSYFTIARFKILKLVVVFMVLASIEETTQIFRATRGFSFADMGANIFGLFVFSKVGEYTRYKLLD
ncbi:MAG: VanZ family protein [Bacteroidia bacterium]